MSIEDEADEIRERIEDLEILLETLQQSSETLELFAKPIKTRQIDT